MPTNGTFEEPITAAVARFDTSATDNPKGSDATNAWLSATTTSCAAPVPDRKPSNCGVPPAAGVTVAVGVGVALGVSVPVGTGVDVLVAVGVSTLVAVGAAVLVYVAAAVLVATGVD